VPQRVTLFHWGERPRATMLALVVDERQLQVIRSPVELTDGGPPADVVVVDVPARRQRAVCEQIRRYYRGRLIVLDPENSGHDLPPDPNRTLLSGHFGIHELSAALSGRVPMQPTDSRLILPASARVGSAGPSPAMDRSMVGEGVPWLGQPWWERRLVRLSTISVTAAVLLVAAFVLVTRGTGCGSACDRLTGADLTAPSSTTVTAVAAGQDTTDSTVGLVGPAATDSTAGSGAAGGSMDDAAATSSPGIAGTTAGPSGAPSPTSPDPTRPPSTAAPTTAAPTTAPITTTTSTAATTTSIATTTTSTVTTTTAPPHPTPPSHTTKP
jgi:hypothetical protein